MTKSASVEAQMSEILEQYGNSAREAINAAAKETADVTVQTLKNTSPTSPHHTKYARSWTVKEERQGSNVCDYIVHNARHYQLTHLLENGHVIRNKKGTYGRTKPIKHIAPAEEAGEMRFELGVRARLRQI